MSYKLRREVANGSLVSISLGEPEVDAYLKFLKHRCRLNTWMSYGYDLQVFLNSIQKQLTEITPADILAFIESQKREVIPGRYAQDICRMCMALRPSLRLVLHALRIPCCRERSNMM